MDGVTILASEEVAIGWEYNYTFIWVGALIGFLVGIGLLIYWGDNGLREIIAILGVLVFIGTMTGVFITVFTSKPIEFETKYQVTISDEVTLQEFNKKYEIIDQKGDLYTIKEKENI